MELLSERNGPVCLLTLNRTERLNAVSLPLYRALTAELREAERDPDVRAIVLTGAGRAFCVGADLKSHGENELTYDDRRTYVRAGQRAHRQMQQSAKPIIAAVNGHAIGAGLELALSSDYVIVAENAKLRFPEIGLGTFVGGGTVYTLPRRVGLLRAKELVLLGDFFTARDAVEWGIANRALPTEEVLPAAFEVARALAEKAPTSVAFARRLLNEAASMRPRRALEREGRALLACMETEDWAEGVRAFAEKRKPEFRGE
jgi:enoyl-CoA hydratase